MYRLGIALTLLGNVLPAVVHAGPVAKDGVALMRRFECHRCHDGLPLPAVLADKHCVNCHKDILRGSFSTDKDTLKHWQSHLQSLNTVPSLHGIGKRLRRDYVAAFLLRPYDVRPSLPAMMPRLDLSAAEAEQIARTLVPSQQTVPPRGDSENGRALFGSFGCGRCHFFSGAALAPPVPFPMSLSTEKLQEAIALAPDLRFARERFQPGALTAWLRSPKTQKPDTLMPSFSLSEQDAEDLATYVLTTPLAPLPSLVVPQRLPLLSRRVSFDEVNAQVFRKTCWHCHSTAAYAKGDGGPGNTGGFGFRGRGFNVTTYADVASGAFDEQGERRSVFVKLSDGTPRLVAILLARQKETDGQIVPGLRGMPLGLPPLSPEQIQLVESWIAQGRPQ